VGHGRVDGRDTVLERRVEFLQALAAFFFDLGVAQATFRGDDARDGRVREARPFVLEDLVLTETHVLASSRSASIGNTVSFAPG
jgi:hypothetical protein